MVEWAFVFCLLQGILCAAVPRAFLKGHLGHTVAGRVIAANGFSDRRRAIAVERRVRVLSCTVDRLRAPFVAGEQVLVRRDTDCTHLRAQC